MLTPAFAPSLPPICIPRVRPHPNQNSRPGPHLLASPRPLPSPLSHTWDLMIAFILIITVFSNPLSMAFEPLSKRLFVFNVITGGLGLKRRINRFSDSLIKIYSYIYNRSFESYYVHH